MKYLTGISYFVLGVLLIAGVGFFLFHSIDALEASVPLDYGEGTILVLARNLAQGRSIYPPAKDLVDYPYILANYPPIYLLMTSLAGQWLGFSYATGRMISVLATLSCSLAIALIIFQATKDKWAAVIAGALFLCSPFVITWGCLARIDMVALALSLWGILVAFRWPDSRVGLGFSLLLFLAAIFTRQSHMLSGPLAIFVFLGARSWRKAFLFVTSLAIAVLTTGGFLNWLTDGGFLFHTVTATADKFMLNGLGNLWGINFYINAPLFVLIIFEFFHFIRSQQWSRLAVAYLMGGILSSLTVGKIGAHINYFLEFIAGMSVLTGFALSRWRKEIPALLHSLLLLTLAFQIYWSYDSSRIFTSQVSIRRAFEPELRQLEEVIRSTPGSVLADEMMAALVVCDKDVLIQPYEFARLSVRGKWDQSPVVEDIKARKFALVLITNISESMIAERWTPDMMAAIMQNYEPMANLAETTVYRPAITDVAGAVRPR